MYFVVGYFWISVLVEISVVLLLCRYDILPALLELPSIVVSYCT